MAWDPTANANVATGDLYTAGLYNLQLGTAGNMAYLGNNHNHATLVGAGGGGYLGLAACLAAGIYPLGQMQGGGANLLRLEYVRVAIETADGAPHNQTISFTNAFGSACVAASYSIEVDASGVGESHIRTFNAAGVTVIYTTPAAGFHIVVGFGYD